MGNFISGFTLFGIIGALIATTLHEFVRAAVSTALGDTTPKRDGRLTLNPVKHFEPIGFILLLITGGFGWGKPVETSSRNYENKKRGMLLTAILPSVANLVMAYILICVATIARGMQPSADLIRLLLFASQYNIALAVYNLLPIAPMDMEKVLSAVIPANHYFKYLRYQRTIQMIGIFLVLIGPLNRILDIIMMFMTSLLGNLVFI